MSFSNFKNNAQPYQNNLNSQHHIIQNNTNFMIERKLVSIHSIDRDLKKWPNSHHFEIKLPEDMINVQSMRLINISFPSNLLSLLPRCLLSFFPHLRDFQKNNFGPYQILLLE